MDEIEQILELLDEIKQKDSLVVVEGLKDKRSLESLGINRIFCLNQPLFAVVEEIAANEGEVVLLTDLDEEGKKLYHKLSVDLQRHGVKINNKLREFLFKTKLRHIEGLSSYVGNAQKL